MNLLVDSTKLKKGLVLAGVLFVVLGVGVGGYYLGVRLTAVSCLGEPSSAEGSSYLKNPFAADKESSAAANPFYQNPFRTVKGLYTEKSE